MSTNDIRTTVTTAVDEVAGYSVSGGYGSYITPAVDALTEREYVLSEKIVEAVVEQFDVPEALVKERLEGIGMAVRPEPEPEVAAEAEGEGDDRVSRLERKINALIAAAERAGVTVHVG